MIADEPMKGVHAACAGGIEESKPSRRGKRQAVTVGNDVGHVVSDESVGAGQHLLFAARVVEPHQAVSGGNGDGSALGIAENPVYAEHVLVFDVTDAAVVDR